MFYTPCEEKVRLAVDKIELYFKNHPEQFKKTDINQLDSNPNVFSVATIDSDNFPNIGMLGWAEDENKVSYCCYDSIRGKHDEQEGVPEEESNCWWEASDLEMFILFLKGEVRKIVHEKYENSSAR